MHKPHLAFVSLLTAVVIGIPVFTVRHSEHIGSTHASPDKTYTWLLAIPSKRGCWPDCSQGQWCWQQACGRYGEWPMTIVPVVGFDRLWMIGNRSTWSSADGLAWQQFASDAQWGERYGMEAVFFKDKLWKMGGMEKTWDNFKNDVWYSTDGTNWKLATPHASWSPRRGHSVIVFQDKLWLLGGAESSGRPDQVPTRILSDVWSSLDGTQWVKVTNGAPWLGNDSAVVFQGKIWFLGPRGVWHSSDGQVWTKALSAPGWMDRSGNGCVVFEEKIWFFGGLMKHGTVNDVWSSIDGVRWQRSVAPWSPRGAEHSIVFNNKLWVYGGKTGRQEDGFNSEVWHMTGRQGQEAGTGEQKAVMSDE